MMRLTEAEVDASLARVEPGLRKYVWLQDKVRRRDVSTDREFQRVFNSFYRMRQRSTAWYQIYYRLMERLKERPVTFDKVLGALELQTARVEASFSSKLVATLDPTKPVIDRFVLQHFELHRPAYSAQNRAARWIILYRQLCQEHANLLASPVGRMICQKFMARYPWAGVTDLKKIDLVLWQAR